MPKLLQPKLLVVLLTLCSTTVFSAQDPDLRVQLSHDKATAEVLHKNKKVTIQRNQDSRNQVNPTYAKTSRNCPPFCIQPATIAPHVDTIAELELIDYLERMAQGDKSILVIDSRTPDWVKKGTIPGSVNIPWTKLSMDQGANPIEVADILERQFGAQEIDGLWDFSNVKTLALFCNGIWCGQSPTNIRALIKLGYPPEKLKWYRGGLQNWENLGLTVVK
ncbi:MAG TPA: sulfurtransferase [Gammaproteobacteria bacterium]|nr:sulfurtransferase [Gammaproteobacteria bacterium]